MRRDDKTDNEYAVARARSARLAFWGGGLLGCVSTAAAVMGIIHHDHVQLVGGLVMGAVAFKVIPFSEAVKLWPWSKD